MAATIRRRMLLTGARHALAPVLDIGRDPRWGRIEETYGEDPYLAAALGCAYIEALQGPDLAEGVIATAKHMVGHGLAEGGLNQAPAHIGERELRDEQLFPFEAAVRRSGIASVMPAYCDVDGVPCHASTALLAGILREEWGFDGIVASDYIGVEMISTAHKLTGDLAEAARLALVAGVDAELPRTVVFGSPLETALADGRVARRGPRRQRRARAPHEVPPRAVRRAVRPDPRTTAILEALAADEDRRRPHAGRALAGPGQERRDPAARDRDRRRVAVIGPIADSARDLLGDYSHLVHMETLREMHEGVGRARHRRRGRRDRAGRRADRAADDPRRAPRRARRCRASATRAAPASPTGPTRRSPRRSRSRRASEVAILVLGERSGLTDDSTTGEFRDRSTLGFHGRQQELLDAVVATGTPVVLVVVSGRPLAIESAAGHCHAILLAWVPGDAGPDAIADVLTGAANPGGKLPVSIPRHVGQVPVTYRHHPTGGHSQPKGDYVDGSVKPLWPFGFGLSYTTFKVDGLRVDRDELATDGGELAVSVEVTNTGDRAGDEVVQLYVRDDEATRGPPGPRAARLPPRVARRRASAGR